MNKWHDVGDDSIGWQWTCHRDLVLNLVSSSLVRISKEVSPCLFFAVRYRLKSLFGRFFVVVVGFWRDKASEQPMSRWFKEKAGQSRLHIGVSSCSAGNISRF